MAFTAWEMYTPCEWEKSQTCAAKFHKCEICNQTHERQGVGIFADERIGNQYTPDGARVKRFSQTYKKTGNGSE